MSLKEALESDQVRPGGWCPVAVLIAGEVPNGSASGVPPLTPEEREIRAEATAPGSTAVLSRALRYLTDTGYKVGATALNAHRRRDCACP